MCQSHYRLLSCVLLVIAFSLAGYASQKTIAERLGYAKDAKLLIIHADDLGFAHSTDQASFYALVHHDVSAASVMMPCPWVTEVVNFARQHPDADLGIHLTLNSQYLTYRWGPVAPHDRVTSLLDPNGYFYHTTREIDKNAQAADVERELRAQVQQALRMGLHPTHLDDHMNTIESREDFYAALVKVGHEFHIPFRAVRPYLAKRGWLSMLAPGDIVIDQWLEPNYRVPPNQWTASYLRMLEKVKPGLNEMIVHVGYDDSELEAITVGRPNWGAAWRQRDFDLVRSTAFKQALHREGIIVIGWKELDQLARP